LSRVNSADFATDHWHQLAVLLLHAPGPAQSFLRIRPPQPGVPTQKRLAGIAASAEHHGLVELLEKHLLAGFLLTPRDLREQWPSSILGLAERLFPDTDPVLLLTASWIHVPILAVQGKNGRVVTMMIGLQPDIHDCRAIGSTPADGLTTKAVSKACRVAARGQGIVYWFLQQVNEQPVRGNSLALPVALGLDFLHRSKPWPEGLFATGGLELNGTIRPVGHIRKKYSCVAPSCLLFLAPVDTDLLRKREQPIQACANFEDALFTATIFSSGTTGEDILLFQACWISEQNFFSHFHKLPLPMIKHKRSGDFVQQAIAEPENHLELVRNCFSRCSHDQERGRILANLFTPETIQSLAGKTPPLDFTAFYWCLAAVAYHNHCGQVAKSQAWENCANELSERVDQREISKYFNHAFVSCRFNRYDFRPDPTPELADVLKREEHKQELYPENSYLLGALYGTLAQNFGFCGPDHLLSLRDMTAKARKTFGRKYHNEQERLLNYEIYAYLDIGNMNKALQLTCRYLGFAGSGESDELLQQAEKLLTAPDPSAPFKAALIIRLLSEINCSPSPDHITEKLSLICRQHGHPWQLISLNLGRMAASAGCLEEAEQLFRHSLQICLKDSDTMYPMGLLALAELHRTDLARDDDYQKAREIMRWIKRTELLNADHFQLLLSLTAPEELLHEVNRKRCRLFPFSYR
jgi:tetratricopeptide (TPR) repeat protein